MLLIAIILRLAASLALFGLNPAEAKIVTASKSSVKYPLNVHNMFRDRIPKKAPVGVWSAWSLWTPCSRSCGGGVTQQTRHCVSRPADSRFIRRQRRRRQANGCVGLYKRIRLCNIQDCPIPNQDFRYEQCAMFNNRLFKGRIFFWEPYLHAPDECALNCRPLGMDFYATLNKTVIDGTSCTRPFTSYGKPAPKGTRGVCITGSCKRMIELIMFEWPPVFLWSHLSIMQVLITAAINIIVYSVGCGCCWCNNYKPRAPTNRIRTLHTIGIALI